MYKTYFKNVQLKKGTGFSLNEGWKVFIQLFRKPKKWIILRDEIGKIGIEMESIILCAKRSMNGDVVSCHKKIWDKCIEKKKALLIYMSDSGYFYRFEPWNIKEFVENMRGEQIMVNFSIRSGQNLLKIKAMQRRIQQRVDKNRQYFDKLTKDERDREIMMRALS